MSRSQVPSDATAAERRLLTATSRRQLTELRNREREHPTPGRHQVALQPAHVLQFLQQAWGDRFEERFHHIFNSTTGDDESRAYWRMLVTDPLIDFWILQREAYRTRNDVRVAQDQRTFEERNMVRDNQRNPAWGSQMLATVATSDGQPMSVILQADSDLDDDDDETNDDTDDDGVSIYTGSQPSQPSQPQLGADATTRRRPRAEVTWLSPVERLVHPQQSQPSQRLSQQSTLRINDEPFGAAGEFDVEGILAAARAPAPPPYDPYKDPVFLARLREQEQDDQQWREENAAKEARGEWTESMLDRRPVRAVQRKDKREKIVGGDPRYY